MGMIGHREVSDLLGAFALDSCTPRESAAIAAHLRDCAACAAEAHRLRDAAGLLAASTGRTPPAGLRARTLRAAHARRTPNPPPVLAYVEQSARLSRLLTSLASERWSTVALGEWTIHDLVAHLAATETLLAVTLGLLDPDPFQGEKDLDRRTSASIARHRGRAPHNSFTEWRGAVELVQNHVSDPTSTLERRIEWVGSFVQLGRVLVSRAFEIWIHADDIRRALGRPPDPPSPPRMRLVADLAVRSLPAALRAVGLGRSGQSAMVVLSGAGGGEWTLALGQHSSDTPGAVLKADVVDFCLLAGGRLAPEEFLYEAEGDTVLAADLIRAAPAFARA